MNKQEARALRAQMEKAFAAASPNLTADELIRAKTLCKAWQEGTHEVGEVRTVDGCPYKCRQAHDTAENPDIVPGNTAWPVFWIPFHGTTIETALPFVQPTCAEDCYMAGEMMVWTDGTVKRAKRQTDHSPEAYPTDWEDVNA